MDVTAVDTGISGMEIDPALLERCWSVYYLEFKSGRQYVGMTKKPLDKRISVHKKSCATSNRELTWRLNNEELVTKSVLHTKLNQDEAYLLEAEEIRLLTQPINRTNATWEYKGEKDPETPWNDPDYAARKYQHYARKRARNRPTRKRCKPPRPGTYTCSHCRERKDWTEFYKDRSRFNGLHSRCKVCQTKLSKDHPYKVRLCDQPLEFFKSNKSARIPTKLRLKLIQQGENICSACREVLPLSDFYANKAYPSGYHFRCISCYREAQRKSRRKRRGYLRGKPLEFFLANRSKKIPTKLRLKLIQQGKNICSVCRSVLPLSNFYVRRDDPSGYFYRCISCSRKAQRRFKKEKKKASGG